MVTVPGVQEKDGYYVWNKGEVFTLGPYFKTSEFSCQCVNESCVEQKISKAIVEKLGNVRVELGKPIKITSAFRCDKHQEALRSAGVNTVVAKKSTHELGDAVDARPVDRNLEGFDEICAKQFMSIGIAKTFLHLDLRKDKIRRWNY